MHQAYGPWVGAPLYALGAAVATSGWTTANTLLRRGSWVRCWAWWSGHSRCGRARDRGAGGDIVPYADPYTGASGIAWHLQF